MFKWAVLLGDPYLNGSGHLAGECPTIVRRTSAARPPDRIGPSALHPAVADRPFARSTRGTRTCAGRSLTWKLSARFGDGASVPQQVVRHLRTGAERRMGIVPANHAVLLWVDGWWSTGA